MKTTLASLSRQEELFGKGYHFEVAIARAALVEGLLLQYLFAAKQIDGKEFDKDTERRLSEERITFGQVKDALKKAGAFHDARLEADVEAFVSDRNMVAHHL